MKSFGAMSSAPPEPTTEPCHGWSGCRTYVRYWPGGGPGGGPGRPGGRPGRGAGHPARGRAGACPGAAGARGGERAPGVGLGVHGGRLVAGRAARAGGRAGACPGGRLVRGAGHAAPGAGRGVPGGRGARGGPAAPGGGPGRARGSAGARGGPRGAGGRAGACPGVGWCAGRATRRRGAGRSVPGVGWKMNAKCTEAMRWPVEPRQARGSRHVVAADPIDGSGRGAGPLRLMSRLSQRRVGSAAGISHSEVSRIERGQAPATRLEVTHGSSRSSVRASASEVYPEGPPLRDAAHARLIGRLRSQIPTGVRLRTEVPIGIHGDLRAWDAMLIASGGQMPLEAETVLWDLQALDRRIALKMADGQQPRVLLLVADTRRNRRIMREFGPLVSRAVPDLHPCRARGAPRRSSSPATSALVML